MSATSIRQEALKLGTKERAELFAAIWDSFFTGEDATVPVTDQQMAEIKRRDRELDEHPERAVSGPDMQARLNALRFKGRG